MTDIRKTLIIGSGPAGMSAAIYLTRFHLEPLVLTGKLAGGQPIWTEKVENYPGFPEGISGTELSQKFFAQAEKFGAQIVPEIVTRLDCTNSPINVWTTSASDQPPDYQTRTLIIATGSEPKKLALPEEEKFFGRGLAFCAICDGPFYKNKIVGVAGSGNKAAEEALLLSRYAEKVYLIIRGATMKADDYLQKQIQENKKIETIFFHQIIQLLGDSQLKKIVIKNTQDQSQKELAIDGLFLAIGQTPANQLFSDQFATDEAGYLLTGEMAPVETNYKTVTSIKNVFAAGDIVADEKAQVIIAAGGGARAALDVQDFLQKEEI
ncbi:MAG: FAD-dependent oxidoreductase [bacterium]|nr:FAD-dependent oxidoreductase [bacterium]